MGLRESSLHEQGCRLALHLYLSSELREGGCDSSLRLPPGGAHIPGRLGKLLHWGRLQQLTAENQKEEMERQRGRELSGLREAF